MTILALLLSSSNKMDSLAYPQIPALVSTTTIVNPLALRINRST